MVQYTLRTMLDSQAGSTATISQKNAAIVIAAMPLVLISPILHKYFAAGITAGAVKG